MEQPTVTEDTIESHLTRNHRRSTVSPYIREIVYGGIDGIITTFAVVAGFSGAQANMSDTALPTTIVLLFGFANLLGDGVSMALGNFLSSRSIKDDYAQQSRIEMKEIQEDAGSEGAQVEYLLTKEGFSKEHSQKITELFQQNPSFLSKFMLQYALKIDSSDGINPIVQATYTFFAFIALGTIPLLPYIFGINNHMLGYSIASTVLALTVLGILRWQITKGKLLHSVRDIYIVGALAASVAYFVGTRFSL